MVVELVGGVVLGVLLAVISQVVDCISASSRAFATKMNEVWVTLWVPGWVTIMLSRSFWRASCARSERLIDVRQVQDYMKNRRLPKALQVKILHYYANFLGWVSSLHVCV